MTETITPTARRTRARTLARTVSDMIAEQVPPEVRAWPDAWAFVEPASRAFHGAVGDWSEGELPEAFLRKQIEHTANALLAAWRDVGVLFDAANQTEGRKHGEDSRGRAAR